MCQRIQACKFAYKYLMTRFFLLTRCSVDLSKNSRKRGRRVVKYVVGVKYSGENQNREEGGA